MTNERVKISDYLAQRLVRKHGVSRVFMITGGGAMHLNDAIGRTPGLDYCCMHHEQACAIAAEGYARASGRLGVVNVTTGPGGTNTLTGVLGQWTDSVPVLYLSGQIKQSNSLHAQPQLRLRQLGDQECDITRVVGPVTKFAETLRDPLDARRLLDKAVHLATSGRPGPVWLDIPMDLQGALIDPAELRDYDPGEDPVPSDPPAKISRVLDLLRGSQRPVLVAGHGIRLARAIPDLLRLAERLGIPVLGTFNGMDLLPSAHPQFIGRIGTLGGRAGNFALQNADLLISVGSRNNTRQVSYNPEFFARAAKKVVVDIDGQELLKSTVVPDLPVVMDAGVFLRGLLDGLGAAPPPDYGPWLAWCQERKRRYPVLPPEGADPGRMDPYRFADSLTRAMAGDAVLVGGDGTASVAPFQAGQVRGTQRFIWNSGCASMGYDLPAAIGACFGTGQGPVLCLAGDGSAMMNLQELETMVHHQLPIKVFLLNNGGYISIRQTQNAYFEGRLTGVDPSSGVGLPDFRRLAEAFGMRTALIESPHGMDAALAAVLAAPGPLLCEVRLPHDYLFEPKLSSAKLPDGRMVSKPLEDLSPLLDREEFLGNMLIPPLAD